MYNLVAFFISFTGLVGARPSGIASKPALASDLNPLLVGGVEVTPGEFPWYLMTQRGGSYSCSAALLTPNSALIAAHCVDGSLPSSLSVQCGIHDRSDLSNVQQVQAVSYSIHESYNVGTGSYPNDIAILILASDLDTSVSNCQLLTLPPDNSEQFAGTTCAITGWETRSTVLHKIEVPIITTAQCDFIMAGVSGADCTDAHIAGFDPSGTQYVCGGEDGPMHCPLSGQTVVAGILSWIVASGGGACLPSYPPVFTRTSYYLGWIADHTP